MGFIPGNSLFLEIKLILMIMVLSFKPMKIMVVFGIYLRHSINLNEYILIP